MKIYLLLLFLCVLYLPIKTLAQNKDTKKAKPKTEKKPAHHTKDEDVKIDTLSKEDIPPEMVTLEDSKIDAGIPVAVIDFDTTLAPADDFTKEILKLLVVTDAQGAEIRMAEMSLNQSIGNDTSAIYTEFKKRFLAELREGRAHAWLQNLYVKAYRSTFTQDDVKALIQFYQTPFGEKLIKKLPDLMQHVMGEGQRIGKYLGIKIMGEIIQDKK